MFWKKKFNHCSCFSVDRLNCFATFWTNILPYCISILLIWELCLQLFPCLQNDESFIYNPWRILKCFATALSLWIILYNLKKYIDVETVVLLGNLRGALNSKEKKAINYYLLPYPEKSNPIIPELERHPNVKEEDSILQSNVELYDYLGTIELGTIMLHRKTITMKEFNNQFGYRINNILSDERLRAHIYNPENNYDFLIETISIMKKYHLIHINENNSISSVKVTGHHSKS